MLLIDDDMRRILGLTSKQLDTSGQLKSVEELKDSCLTRVLEKDRDVKVNNPWLGNWYNLENKAGGNLNYFQHEHLITNVGPGTSINSYERWRFRGQLLGGFNSDFWIRFSLRLDYEATNADGSTIYRATQTGCDVDNYPVEGSSFTLRCSTPTWPSYTFVSANANLLRVNGLDFTHNKPW